MAKCLCFLTLAFCFVFETYSIDTTSVELAMGQRGQMVEVGIAASHQPTLPFGIYYGATAAIAGDHVVFNDVDSMDVVDRWVWAFTPLAKLGIAYSIPITSSIGLTLALFETTGALIWLTETERQADLYGNSINLGIGGLLKLRFGLTENLKLYAAFQPMLEAVAINTSGASLSAFPYPFRSYYSLGVAY